MSHTRDDDLQDDMFTWPPAKVRTLSIRERLKYLFKKWREVKGTKFVYTARQIFLSSDLDKQSLQDVNDFLKEDKIEIRYQKFKKNNYYAIDTESKKVIEGEIIQTHEKQKRKYNKRKTSEFEMHHLITEMKSNTSTKIHPNTDVLSYPNTCDLEFSLTTAADFSTSDDPNIIPNLSKKIKSSTSIRTSNATPLTYNQPQTVNSTQQQMYPHYQPQYQPYQQQVTPYSFYPQQEPLISTDREIIGDVDDIIIINPNLVYTPNPVNTYPSLPPLIPPDDEITGDVDDIIINPNLVYNPVNTQPEHLIPPNAYSQVNYNLANNRNSFFYEEEAPNITTPQNRQFNWPSNH